MRDENRSDADVAQIPSGFVNKMINAMPPFVNGIVGSFLGISIAILVVLKLGGMDVPLSRIINAYAAGIEAQVGQVARNSATMVSITAEIKQQVALISEKATRLEKQAAEQSLTLNDLDSRVSKVTGRVFAAETQTQALDERINGLERWACGQPDYERSFNCKARKVAQ